MFSCFFLIRLLALVGITVVLALVSFPSVLDYLMLFLLIALVISFSTSSSTFLSFFRLILSSLGSNQFLGEMGAQRDNEI